MKFFSYSDCQVCQQELSEWSFGIVRIVIRCFQNLYQGLSQELSEIIRKSCCCVVFCWAELSNAIQIDFSGSQIGLKGSFSLVRNKSWRNVYYQIDRIGVAIKIYGGRKFRFIILLKSVSYLYGLLLYSYKNLTIFEIPN